LLDHGDVLCREGFIEMGVWGNSKPRIAASHSVPSSENFMNYLVATTDDRSGSIKGFDVLVS